jgi:hypothetical protein
VSSCWRAAAAAALGFFVLVGCARVVPDASAPARPVREVSSPQTPPQRLAPFYWTTSDTVRIHLDRNVVYRFVLLRDLDAQPGRLTFWPADSVLPTTPLQYRRLLQTFRYGKDAVAMLYTPPHSGDYLFLPPSNTRLEVARLRTSWASDAKPPSPGDSPPRS